MRNVLAIAWREIRTYFTSPLAYVVLGVFLALSGYIFWASLVRYSELSLRFGNSPYASMLNINDMVIRPLFGSMGIIFLLMIPVITMRLLADEWRTGTAELLFTCPVTSAQVVLGKFAGAAFLLLAMLAPTLSYPYLIRRTGAQTDLKSALVGYLGILLMGLSFMALGLLVSSLTENQVVAAVGSFGALLILWILNWVAESESATVTLASMLNTVTVGLWEKLGLGMGGPTVGDLLNKLSLMQHSQDFRKGLLDTEHLVFYLSFIFMSLFLTQRVVESQKWR